MALSAREISTNIKLPCLISILFYNLWLLTTIFTFVQDKIGREVDENLGEKLFCYGISRSLWYILWHGKIISKNLFTKYPLVRAIFQNKSALLSSAIEANFQRRKFYRGKAGLKENLADIQQKKIRIKILNPKIFSLQVRFH